MARLALVREDEMTPEQQAQFQRFPSNLTRGVLLAPPRLAQALPEVANALRASGLDLAPAAAEQVHFPTRVEAEVEEVERVEGEDLAAALLAAAG